MFEGLKCKNFIRSRISDTKSSWEKKLKLRITQKAPSFHPWILRSLINACLGSQSLLLLLLSCYKPEAHWLLLFSIFTVEKTGILF